MADITLHFTGSRFSGEVHLPASKSISNRVLIINAIAGSGVDVDNLSDCDDTKVMAAVLQSDGNRFDIGHAGTAMRFLTAFLARIAGRWEITGSARMQERPIGVLVDALNGLGARIEYAGQTGYPPLRITGSYLMGGEITVPASISSQYISALLMIAPYMAKGLELKLEGKIVSREYIGMTLAIMKIFGADVSWEGQVIRVAPQFYVAQPFRVESDWSAASYFYELLAVAGQGQLHLPGLEEGSMQGDAGQVELWERLGVATHFVPGGVVISGGKPGVEHLEVDFVEMPDVVQSFVVACCLKGVTFVFEGVETLRIKETDRLSALTVELAKIGFCVKTEGDGRIMWDGGICETEDGHAEIATYHDHRMAMAFAPAALKHPGLVIVDKDVVSKSFPGFWTELEGVLA